MSKAGDPADLQSAWDTYATLSAMPGTRWDVVLLALRLGELEKTVNAIIEALTGEKVE